MLRARRVRARVGASREAAARSDMGAARSGIEDHLCVHVVI